MDPTFGTDGVRGLAFEELDEVVAHAIGRAANRALFASDGFARWVVGRDTRESSPALTRALVAGLRAMGAEVLELGVVSTPVVAFAAQHLDTAGAMVSASHNPWHDNGVKLFAAGGIKLSDAEQSAVSQCLDDLGLTHGDRPSSMDMARRRLVGLGTEPAIEAARHGAAGTAADQAADCAASTGVLRGVLAAYAASLSEAIDGRTLEGLHVVVDGANGASALLAPAVLRQLGAQVTTRFCEPDGRNINDGCGSVSPGALQSAVRDVGADIGLAFDGDGDRLIAVDSDGQVVDGDRQMALFAVDLAERGELAGNTLVVTVMSNLGLRRAMAAAGIEVVETAVGDRAVLEALDTGGHSLGGEQSGHVVFRNEATTGDGLRSAVHLADLVSRRGETSSSAALADAAMRSAPQVLLNVSAETGLLDAGNRRAIDDIAGRAGPDVRVLVRVSGTEPVIRIMVEAPTEREAADLADRLAELVRLAGAG